MHPLLSRQLKHAGVSPETMPENIAALLRAVDAAYDQIDADRRLSERSLELTSQELLERNRELTARNRELDALRQAGLDCIITMDHEGRIREFNPAAEKTFGYRRDEAIGRMLAELVIPEQHRKAQAGGLAAFLKSGFGPVLGKRIEVSAVRRDGSEFPVELAISIVRMEGKPLFVAYLRDITDRKLAGAESRRAEKLALVASRTDNAVIITDVNGLIEWVNDGFTRISGYAPQEVVGRKPGSFLQGPETDPQTVSFIRERLNRGEGFKTEILNYNKEGRKYWLAIEVQPIFGADGKLRNFMAIESDISERKRVERELQQAKEQAEAASRAKSEFLANMSHEIRTPLNGVTGMTELLLGTELAPHQRRYVQIAKSSADSLLVVINQILDFSKIEAGKLELEILDFDLREVVEEVTEMLACRAASKGLELAYWIEPAVTTTLRGDPVRLRQVLINLVNNAVKFTDNGEVIVRVASESTDSGRTTLRFSVSDTGVGIPPDRSDRLFKPFSQVDASTTRKFGGTGLGLVICKQLTEMMGGQIGVESAPGRGSTFWFTAGFEVRAADRPAIRPQSLAGMRVLAVEENTAVRHILRDQLASWGLRIDEASDVEAAVRLARAAAEGGRPYDMIVIDLAADGSAGMTLARQIRSDRSLSASALILLTSLESPEPAREVVAGGSCQLVTKPVRQSQLFDAVIRSASAAAGGYAEKPQHPIPVSSPFAAVRPARILVAEDNEVNQIVAAEILNRAGFRCDIVGDGARAVAAALEQKYDAILMDCQMPDLDGFQATAAIRAAESSDRAAGRPAARMPIIALTANALKGDREQCIAAGMDDYLSKPLDPRQLIETLNRILGKASPARAEPGPERSRGAAPMDLDALLVRCMGDADFRDRLLRTMPAQVSGAVSRIGEAVASGNATRLAREAHGLKGTAANLSAAGVQRMAAELELLGTAGRLGDAEKRLAELRSEVEKCIAFIRDTRVAVDGREVEMT